MLTEIAYRILLNKTNNQLNILRTKERHFQTVKYHSALKCNLDPAKQKILGFDATVLQYFSSLQTELWK